MSAVLVDDHPATRAGVTYWFGAADPPIAVLASGDDVKVAWTPPGDRADVVVLDLELGGVTPALTDVRRLAEAQRNVIVYSMHAEGEVVLRALALGALSYLTKAEGEEHLVAATRAAASRRPYTPPTLAGALAADRDPHRPVLSARETEVLIEWFQSESKDFVARRLGISTSTVNSHLERVRVKYALSGREASTKASLLARAIQDGIVDLDEL